MVMRLLRFQLQAWACLHPIKTPVKDLDYGSGVSNVVSLAGIFRSLKISSLVLCFSGLEFWVIRNVFLFMLFFSLLVLLLEFYGFVSSLECSSL